MAIALRLSRGGAKKRPYYRIVAADSRSPRDGKYLEQIGVYNPLLAKDDPARVKLNEDRARHWLEVGAQPSDRVARFLDAAGVRERAARSNPNKGKPGEKATERAEERATKETERKEAEEAAKAEAAAKPAEEVKEEAPAEEAATEAPAEEAKDDEAPAEEAKAEEAPAEEAKADDAASEDKSEDKAEG